MILILSQCRHDPDAEGAVVMKAPTEEHMTKYNKKYSLPSVS